MYVVSVILLLFQSHSCRFRSHSCGFRRIPVPFLWNPPESAGITGILQEWEGHCKVLDNNWKKMINMVSSLCKKWKHAKLGLSESFQALEELSASASKEQIQEWEQQIKTANLNQAKDLSSMDIYYIKVKEAETEKGIRLKLMTKEQEGKVKSGLTG
ncbi:uncharacterized protein LACBIDRAFT_312546 [Laccaria bicolor S238N-H82]|uniref:Predicted protein n=1 Tax=Laccaria bicolor (strain S238N-H82 / ATCC MYA-4686) TaxID=486041 RepID=B0DWC9_LACBS|nr:uncharacterized protein LACBIDRAFT_312546 [Laccaria bicolor S238N-H82]EDR01028.1 predicted protein [Laccaria bicolor S238N-H82]|eukprot:XP_001888247.1 predicted protein [Laccaria bicolor S238N-H82]